MVLPYNTESKNFVQSPISLGWAGGIDSGIYRLARKKKASIW
jgi:hypothetical protein